MEIKEIYEGINWKTFILGTALFSFIVVAAMDFKLEILLVFSSIGILYIGYDAKNTAQGIFLGAISTIPLFLVTVFTERLGPISGNDITMWILISFLAIGAFCGFTGSYFNTSRNKAIDKKIAMEENETKKKESGKVKSEVNKNKR